MFVKQRLYDADHRHLWEFRPPAPAASPSRLAEVEAALHRPLDPGYRALLEHADGWPAFYQSVDLFGTTDLLGGPQFLHAQRMLEELDEVSLDASSLLRGDLMPIAASRVDTDMFLVVRGGSAPSGTVVWFGAGAEVERYPSFEEFFLAMLDYNRAEIDALRQS